MEKVQRGGEEEEEEEAEAFRLSETELSLAPGAAHSTEMKPEIGKRGRRGKQRMKDGPHLRVKAHSASHHCFGREIFLLY